MRGMTIYNTGKLNVGTWMTGGKEEGKGICLRGWTKMFGEGQIPARKGTN